MDGISVEVLDLSKNFGSNNIFSNISFKINSGDSLIVIGPSGTGKSVLLKTIIGLTNPSDGTVKINNESFYSLSSKQKNDLMKNVGVLFQGGALFDSLKVWENISFSLIHNFSVSRSKAKEIAIEKLSDVGLDKKVADLYPSELSGGMQKRAALARAIATDPKLILFDEPTAGLDPINTSLINELIIKCSKKLGATTITITHDMSSVRAIGGNIIMLYDKNIVWSGLVSDIENSDNNYINQFVNGLSQGPILPK